MTVEEIRAILQEVRYPGYAWRVKGAFENGGSVTLHAVFLAEDIKSPERVVMQATRKWILSQHMVPGEVVQTALKCVLTAVEHEVRESFTYRDQQVFGPHFDIEQLVQLCRHGATEMRP